MREEQNAPGHGRGYQGSERADPLLIRCVLQPKAELEELPEELCGLPSLQYLDVSGNKVTNHSFFLFTHIP